MWIWASLWIWIEMSLLHSIVIVSWGSRCRLESGSGYWDFMQFCYYAAITCLHGISVISLAAGCSTIQERYSTIQAFPAANRPATGF